MKGIRHQRDLWQDTYKCGVFYNERDSLKIVKVRWDPDTGQELDHDIFTLKRPTVGKKETKLEVLDDRKEVRDLRSTSAKNKKRSPK